MMNRTILFFLAFFIGVLVAPFNSWAVDPHEMLEDPVLEQRAREISKGLRCLVCANESIDESNAGLARDLRVLVRERLTKGDSNEQVTEFIVSRYGDYVLLKPPFKLNSVLLWLGPALMFLIAAFGVQSYYRAQAVREDPDISQDRTKDEQIIEALLDEAALDEYKLESQR
jgi:cytochrome c-type biogenesis protein CcmH